MAVRRPEVVRQAPVSSEAIETRPPDQPSIPLTPSIGRQGIMEALLALLALLRRDGVRLVTLSGPGGVGKTRLALRAVETSAPDFPDGMAVVGLAATPDPTLVLPMIARALDVREAAGLPLLEAVALGNHTDSPEEILLVLDGEVEFLVGEERATAGAGTLAVVPSMVEHGIRNVGQGRARVVGFFPNPGVVATFASAVKPLDQRVMIFGEAAIAAGTPS